jgi:hypothetical protein
VWLAGARPPASRASRARELGRAALEGYRPLAERYGGWYRAAFDAVEAWLAALKT